MAKRTEAKKKVSENCEIKVKKNCAENIKIHQKA